MCRNDSDYNLRGMSSLSLGGFPSADKRKKLNNEQVAEYPALIQGRKCSPDIASIAVCIPGLEWMLTTHHPHFQDLVLLCSAV